MFHKVAELNLQLYCIVNKKLLITLTELIFHYQLVNFFTGSELINYNLWGDIRELPISGRFLGSRNSKVWGNGTKTPEFPQTWGNTPILPPNSPSTLVKVIWLGGLPRNLPKIGSSDLNDWNLENVYHMANENWGLIFFFRQNLIKIIFGGLHLPMYLKFRQHPHG